MNSEALNLDANMERLVAALNGCPGIHPFSSCGGHTDPDLGHAPQDEFNVCFTVEPTAGGWPSLELILRACGEDAKLVAWWAAENHLPGAVAFQLEGRGKTTPDRIAEAIERARS
ncbi:MAG: hypothetical protein JSW46_10045 [Gemmatimonadota bacterium]|nr:MAG: hypothetical protein JSW46_10045 [Gemmatimonadota bacterium]